MLAALPDLPWFSWPIALGILELLSRIALCIRVILRRTPVPDTLAWLVVLLLVPIVGTVLYFLIGEPRLGTRRSKRYEAIARRTEEQARHIWAHQHWDWASHAYAPLARLATRLTNLPTLRGNSLELIGDAQNFLDRLIHDVEHSQHHCHMLFYIWEPDDKGRAVAEALIRASTRGITCRVLVDGAGSSNLIGSELWNQMIAAGVRCVVALPVNPIRLLFSRVDLRNHRKIAVIDGAIAYCGSQNITEENFRPRKGSKAGPWIDATVRVTGPAAHALQVVFMQDWELDSEEPHEHIEQYIEPLLEATLPGSSIVHVVPSGPGPRPDAIHQGFLTMLYAAREEIIMSTPYFVPDEATKSALQNAAMRGVAVTLFVPEVSDNRIVAAASRSHYEDLLEAGVKIRLHQRGLLHSKTATVDRSLSVIGSANFDQRSFWLNFEATLFIYDPDFAGLLRFLQLSYVQESREIRLQDWRRRSVRQRFLDNAAQLMGPLL